MVLQDISTDILIRAKKVTAVLIRKQTLPFAFSSQFCTSEPGLQSPLVADFCLQIFQFETHPSSPEDLQPINSGRICLGMRFLRPGSLCSLLHLGSPSSSVQFSSVAQSCPTLRPHDLHHAKPPCPSLTLGVHSDSRPSSQ